MVSCTSSHIKRNRTGIHKLNLQGLESNTAALASCDSKQRVCQGFHRVQIVICSGKNRSICDNFNKYYQKRIHYNNKSFATDISMRKKAA